MKLTPIQGPGQVKDTSTPEHVRTARATEAFNRAGQESPQQSSQASQSSQPSQTSHHSVNQNSVSPEEMSAIIPQTAQEEGQDGSIDTSTQEATGTQPETKDEVKKSEDPLSSQYALLARKEKALRLKAQQQEQSLKTREEALNKRLVEMEAKAKAYETDYVPKSRLKSETLNVLAENELSYDELTQQLINQQTPQDPRVTATISRLEAKIKQLEEVTEKSNKTYQEQQTQAYASAVKQIETDVRQMVAQDPEYEMIHTTKSVKDVVRLIEKTYQEEGRLMSNEEAAKEVEDYLTEQAETLSRINKIQKRLNASVSKPQTKAPAQTAVQPKQPQPMKTLTNAVSSSRPLTNKERALLAFKGELKS